MVEMNAERSRSICIRSWQRAKGSLACRQAGWQKEKLARGSWQLAKLEDMNLGLWCFREEVGNSWQWAKGNGQLARCNGRNIPTSDPDF